MGEKNGHKAYKSSDTHKDTQRKEQRKIQINYALNELLNRVDENLGNDEGKEMKKQRCIQVEGAFGVIKQDMNYARLRRRGRLNVKTELLLIGIAYNICKYHNKKSRKRSQIIS